MKREYLSGCTPTPSIPFQENLIFHAPLTQGDLTDHISGSNLTVTSPATCTWDSSKEMYYFNASNMGYYNTMFRWFGLSLGLINNASTTASLHFTVSWYCIIDITSWTTVYGEYLWWSRWIPSMSYVKSQGNYSYAGFIDSSDYLGLKEGDYGRFTLVINGSSILFYKDGTLVNTTNTNLSRGGSVYYNNIDTNICIYYMYKRSTDHGHSGACHYKDIRVYNRSLSASEVAQL